MAKKKTVGQIEDELRSDLGEEKVQRGKDVARVTKIPTGVFSIDEALGGGIPKSRITEIYGKPSSCKTLLLTSAIANAQQQGDVAVYIDLEKTFDPDWAEKHGVDLEELIYIKPADGEEAYSILLDFLEADEVGIIGLDSVAQAVPRAELEGNFEANIGLAARLNAKAMRKITGVLGNTAVVLVNQTRANVSTGPFQGKAEVTAGGKAIPFYASLRLNLRRIGWVKSGSDAVGGKYRLRVDKCKVSGAQLYSVCQFEVDFDRGLDIAKDVLLYAMVEGWVKKAGSWYKFGDDNNFQGEQAAKDHMIESGLLEEWKEKLRNKEDG